MPNVEPNISLNKNQRLIQSRKFKETFSQKKKIVGKYMIIWLRYATDSSLKLGLISSKKIHNRAHKRNRVRRWLRESYRHIRPYLSNRCDVIIVARKSMLEAKWIDIHCELAHLLYKAKLISTESYDVVLTQLNQK